jgi:hypothetical protein
MEGAPGVQKICRKPCSESVLAAKMSVREAAGRFNFPKNPLQGRILKIRRGSEIKSHQNLDNLSEHSPPSMKKN